MYVINVYWIRPCPLYTPPVAPTDWMSWWVDWNRCYFLTKMVVIFENLQTRLSRGRRSRNKVSVGEPAEGSLSVLGVLIVAFNFFQIFIHEIENHKLSFINNLVLSFLFFSHRYTHTYTHVISLCQRGIFWLLQRWRTRQNVNI